MQIAPAVTISEEQARQLQAAPRGRRLEVRLAQREQMILRAAQGIIDQAIAAQLKIARRTPARWRQRFLEQGPVGIERDAPRAARKLHISAEKMRQVIAKTTAKRRLRRRTGARARWRHPLASSKRACGVFGVQLTQAALRDFCWRGKVQGLVAFVRRPAGTRTPSYTEKTCEHQGRG